MNSALTSQTTLPNFDDEPIHIPGSIQPHGALLVLKEPQLTILQVSENTEALFGVAPETLLQRDLTCLFDRDRVETLRHLLLRNTDLDRINPVLLSRMRDGKTQYFDGILHRRDGCCVLEIEPTNAPGGVDFSEFYYLVRNAADNLQKSISFSDLCQSLVKEIRHINGFDRVMLYKYNSDGHGTVVAEARDLKVPSYLDLHYPSTDVPPRARQLFMQNWVRTIVDFDAVPAPLVPVKNPRSDRPLDMSDAVLRSVSPCHVEYLQNMGVRASMSIAIVKDGALWGLLACHHRTPRHVPYEIRKACEFLGQVTSWQITDKEQREHQAYKIKLQSIQTKLIEHVLQQPNFVDGLLNFHPNLLGTGMAMGAATFFNGECRVIGKAPSPEAVKDLVAWLSENHPEELFHTDSLTKLYPPAEAIKDVASGLLAIAVPPNNYVLWFRPEVIQTVAWAGDPREPYKVDEASLRYSPRKSFDLWQEIVRFKSQPWKQCELETALELRSAIINIFLRQAEELKKFNAALQASEARERERATQLEAALTDLQQAQMRLIQSEKMSGLGQLVAGVAHEINNPINFIYGNLVHADTYTRDILTLVELYREALPAPSQAIADKMDAMDLDFLQEDLPKLLHSMRVGADRIRTLVESLRNFSRLDEAEMKPVDIHEGIESTLVILGNRLKARPDRPEIEIVRHYGELPLVECYASQLNQVFMNLIANAIDAIEECDRPNSGSACDRITIVTAMSDTNPSKAIIRIGDNGSGIPAHILPRIFDPFFTTKPPGKGTGMGLAISYQIATERHRGIMTCDSQLGKGTEFVVQIPITQAP